MPPWLPPAPQLHVARRRAGRRGVLPLESRRQALWDQLVGRPVRGRWHGRRRVHIACRIRWVGSLSYVTQLAQGTWWATETPSVERSTLPATPPSLPTPACGCPPPQLEGAPAAGTIEQESGQPRPSRPCRRSLDQHVARFVTARILAVQEAAAAQCAKRLVPAPRLRPAPLPPPARRCPSPTFDPDRPQLVARAAAALQHQRRRPAVRKREDSLAIRIVLCGPAADAAARQAAEPTCLPRRPGLPRAPGARRQSATQSIIERLERPIHSHCAAPSVQFHSPVLCHLHAPRARTAASARCCAAPPGGVQRKPHPAASGAAAGRGWSCYSSSLLARPAAAVPRRRRIVVVGSGEGRCCCKLSYRACCWSLTLS